MEECFGLPGPEKTDAVVSDYDSRPNTKKMSCSRSRLRPLIRARSRGPKQNQGVESRFVVRKVELLAFTTANNIVLYKVAVSASEARWEFPELFASY